MDQNNSYVSCIKIHGVPLLPPLITCDKRQELQEYKNKALILEKLYFTRKLNKQKVENYGLIKSKSKDIMTDHQSRNNKEILDNFGMLKYVPFKNENSKILNLSSGLIDVSEYSSDTKENFGNHSMYESISGSAILDLDQPLFCGAKGNTKTSDIFSGDTEIILEGNLTDLGNEKEVFQRPRLIRSNSYTLDNPSPLLLAHLKRQSSVSLSSDQVLTDNCTEDVDSFSIKSDNCPKMSHNPDKTNILENSVDIQYTNASKTNENSDVIKEKQETGSDLFSKPTVEVITTDITVQQINITTPINDITEKNIIAFLNENAKANADEKARSHSVKEQNCTPDTETELKLILKQIPEVYSSKILNLIEKQRIEQEKGLQNEISTQRLLDRGDFQNNITMNIQVDNDIENWAESCAQQVFPKNISDNIEIIRKARSISESTTLNSSDTLKQGRCSVAESQSLYFDLSTSCSDPLEDFSSRTVKNIEHEDEEHIDYRTIYDKMYLDHLTQSNEKLNFVYKRAPVNHERIVQREEENKAASIIGAYVKGYLVRRLMKTTRVQSLIQTIQDALLCALELQRLETIEEADVELHRRLIQQVSAACYEFHDVFFALTIPEQMDLIAIDREKKQKISPVRTSRSSIDIHPKGRSSSNARLTKSLTKV